MVNAKRTSDVRTRFHPRAADASVEKLREVAGFFVLKGLAPSHRFLDVSEEQPTERARD